MTTSTVTILLVEDDEIDVEAVRRTFEDLKILNPIRVARDGLEALDVLRGGNGQERIAAPYLIILDLNMPRMNGLEFLQAIRGDAQLKDSLVFVLTTSNGDADRLNAYSYNVAGYILKNNPVGSFMNAISMLDHYWRAIEFPEG